MIRRLIILLLIVGLFAQDNDASIIRFDPETGEIIESDSLEIHNPYQLIFDPYTGEQIISFDTLGLYDSSKIIPRNSYSGNIVHGSPLKDKSKFHKNYKKLATTFSNFENNGAKRFNRVCKVASEPNLLQEIENEIKEIETNTD